MDLIKLNDDNFAKLQQLLRQAFDADFDVSSEGFNGEYVDSYDKEQNRRVSLRDEYVSNIFRVTEGT